MSGCLPKLRVNNDVPYCPNPIDGKRIFSDPSKGSGLPPNTSHPDQLATLFMRLCYLETQVQELTVKIEECCAQPCEGFDYYCTDEDNLQTVRYCLPENITTPFCGTVDAGTGNNNFSILWLSVDGGNTYHELDGFVRNGGTHEQFFSNILTDAGLSVNVESVTFSHADSGEWCILVKADKVFPISVINKCYDIPSELEMTDGIGVTLNNTTFYNLSDGTTFMPTITGTMFVTNMFSGDLTPEIEDVTQWQTCRACLQEGGTYTNETTGEIVDPNCVIQIP